MFMTKLITRTLAFVFLSFFSVLATAGTITVSSPGKGATVAVPFNVNFTYSGMASYMKLWIDGKAIVAQDGTSTFGYTVSSLASGSHVLALQAHDTSSNTTYTTDVSITVVSGSTGSSTSTGTSTGKSTSTSSTSASGLPRGDPDSL